MTAPTISSTVVLMMPLRKGFTKPFGTGLAIWMLAVGAAIPFLDGEFLDSDIAFDSGHHETCGILLHDHTFCSQFGRQPWATMPAAAEKALPPSVMHTVVTRRDASPRPGHSTPTNPRAPPIL